MEPLKVLGHFLFHVIVAMVIFAAIMGAAWLLWELTEWLGRHDAPYILVVVGEVVAYLLFAVDVVCLGFFVIVEGIKLLKEIAMRLR